MKITAAWPLIEIGLYGATFKILRYFDRGFTSDKFKTKLPSIQTYIDLHSGPEFAIHWRYSAVLLQLSIALFFGTGLPILYFIALVGCIIQYITDRLLICYFYREPPTYDDRMTLVASSALKFVAALSLIGSWYQLRSKSIFQMNEAIQADKEYYFLSPPHIPIIVLLALIVNRLFCGIGAGTSNKRRELAVHEEGLAEYWEALHPKIRSTIKDREKYYQD